MAENFLDRIGKAIAGRSSAPQTIGKVSPTQTLGSSLVTTAELAGTVGGVIGAPDRILNLVGQRRWDEFDRMVRDISIIAAGVRAFLNLIANAVWTVNPPDGLEGAELETAQGYADQVYNDIYSMTSSWAQVVRKAAAFRLYGFAILEWTAKRNDDGTIGLLDVEHRPQRTIARWIRDDSGTVEAVVQQISGRQEVTLPRSKIVYAVDDVLTDSPEGIGLFRHLYVTAERLAMFLELEEIGYTTDLRGIPIARAPLGEEEARVVAAGLEGTEARKSASAILTSKLSGLREFVTKHIRNKKMGLLLPSDTYSGRTADGSITPSTVPKWALELLNGNSSGFEGVAEAVKRMTHDLARVLGAEHLLLGQDGGGSLAMARSKVGTFYLTVTSTMQDLVEVFDRDLVGPLSDLNGWEEHLRPEMGVNEISDRDIDQVTSALKDMALAGATLMPDDPAIGEIRDILGLSRPPADGLAMDAALLGNKGLAASVKPQPNDPKTGTMTQNPEDGGVAKSRVIKARRRRLRNRAR